MPLLSLLLLPLLFALGEDISVPDLHPEVLQEDILGFSQTIPQFMLEVLRAGHEKRLTEQEQREIAQLLFWQADIYGDLTVSNRCALDLCLRRG
jgi:hypothetical protein